MAHQHRALQTLLILNIDGVGSQRPSRLTKITDYMTCLCVCNFANIRFGQIELVSCSHLSRPFPFPSRIHVPFLLQERCGRCETFGWHKRPGLGPNCSTGIVQADKDNNGNIQLKFPQMQVGVKELTRVPATHALPRAESRSWPLQHCTGLVLSN